MDTPNLFYLFIFENVYDKISIYEYAIVAKSNQKIKGSCIKRGEKPFNLT